ncbi:unnamed protein product [Spirodela intermedia]|uniref:Uncharacterized protein n=1 Tax=Spirodela intermedia TaxID=51605 RepID=A0ABN7EBI6_SPIIN|nr:unnamed protein product [Spirodela intermedia]
MFLVLTTHPLISHINSRTFSSSCQHNIRALRFFCCCRSTSSPISTSPILS